MKYITKEDIVLKKRKKTSHKGENGKVLIIGGSIDYVGAVALAGLAALRTGCDWVTIAAPEKVAWAVNTLSPDLITKKLSGKHIAKKHAKELLTLAKKFDVILVGNGLGTKTETKSFVKEFVKKCKRPLVLDADAIKVVNVKELNNVILTPQKAELNLFLKNSKHKKKSTKDLQKFIGTNVLLIKGPVDHILSHHYVMYNRTGNEGLTVAGTGDILAGLVAGFIAQGYDKFTAACYSAYISGHVGDLLLKKKGYYSFIASDLIDDIEDVIIKLERQKSKKHGTRKKRR